MKQSIIAAMAFIAFAAGMNFFFEFVLDVSLLEWFEGLVKKPGLPAAAAVVVLLVIDVALPVPSSVVMVLSGALFGTVAGGVLSLAGSLIGNFAGFELMRRFGLSVFRGFVKEDHVRRMRPVVEQFGAAAIAVSRPLPIVCETASLVAGTLGMKRASFIIAAFLGTVPVAFIYSYAGSSSTGAGSVFPAIFILVCVPALSWLLAHKRIFRALSPPLRGGVPEGRGGASPS